MKTWYLIQQLTSQCNGRVFVTDDIADVIPTLGRLLAQVDAETWRDARTKLLTLARKYQEGDHG